MPRHRVLTITQSCKISNSRLLRQCLLEQLLQQWLREQLFQHHCRNKSFLWQLFQQPLSEQLLQLSLWEQPSNNDCRGKNFFNGCSNNFCWTSCSYKCCQNNNLYQFLKDWSIWFQNFCWEETKNKKYQGRYGHLHRMIVLEWTYYGKKVVYEILPGLINFIGTDKKT